MSADVISLRRSQAKTRSKRSTAPPNRPPLPLAAEVEYFLRRIDIIPGWLKKDGPKGAAQSARLLAVCVADLKRAQGENSETAGRSLAHVLALSALGQGVTRAHIDGACRGIKLVLALLDEINHPRPSGGDSAA